MANRSSNAGYVDGFVFVVAEKNLAAYRKMAIWGGKTWMKHGALEYLECVGDDLIPSMGGVKAKMNFPKMAKLKKGETVWFSFITYKSKKHRDEVNKKVMKEMEKNADKYKDMVMPFDEKRMSTGGFRVVVNAK